MVNDKQPAKSVFDGDLTLSERCAVMEHAAKIFTSGFATSKLSPELQATKALEAAYVFLQVTYRMR